MNWTTYFIAILSVIGLLIIVLYFYYRRLNSKIFKPYETTRSDALPKLWSEKTASLDKMDKMLAEDKVSVGKLTFDVPFLMSTGRKYRIKCLISRLPIILMPERDTIIIHEIPVSDVMSCSLIGDAFTISKISNDIQRVIQSEDTIWQWNVTPKKWGIQELLLLASIHEHTESGTHLKDIPVFERPIVVKINPSYQVRQFFIKHWQWLVGTIIGSGIIWQILKASING